ncbi:hypothetical protein OUZ56_011522 [Daphnia magna]|uniref:Uncharacterized protein n=1 Tax=Daphnia magna TaxID=35525 RepID=A0ABQ9Z0M1_9CRUS|nr:hypothetical protein OUZ56_011522 [Daphnia magna]
MTSPVLCNSWRPLAAAITRRLLSIVFGSPPTHFIRLVECDVRCDHPIGIQKKTFPHSLKNNAVAANSVSIPVKRALHPFPIGPLLLTIPLSTPTLTRYSMLNAASGSLQCIAALPDRSAFSLPLPGYHPLHPPFPFPAPTRRLFGRQLVVRLLDRSGSVLGAAPTSPKRHRLPFLLDPHDFPCTLVLTDFLFPLSGFSSFTSQYGGLSWLLLLTSINRG